MRKYYSDIRDLESLSFKGTGYLNWSARMVWIRILITIFRIWIENFERFGSDISVKRIFVPPLLKVGLFMPVERVESGRFQNVGDDACALRFRFIHASNFVLEGFNPWEKLEKPSYTFQIRIFLPSRMSPSLMLKCPRMPLLYPSTHTTVVPGMVSEFVVSDCDVPTPELSLITSDAVSPRLLSEMNFPLRSIQVSKGGEYFSWYANIFLRRFQFERGGLN